MWSFKHIQPKPVKYFQLQAQSVLIKGEIVASEKCEALTDPGEVITFAAYTNPLQDQISQEYTIHPHTEQTENSLVTCWIADPVETLFPHNTGC